MGTECDQVYPPAGGVFERTGILMRVSSAPSILYRSDRPETDESRNSHGLQVVVTLNSVATWSSYPPTGDVRETRAEYLAVPRGS